MTLTPDRRVRRSWLVLAVVVVVVVAAVIVASLSYATAERRRSVEIVNAEELDDVVLLLAVDSCGGEPTVTELDQAEAEVRIAVESTTRLLASETNDCQDGVEVQLDAPLGDRVLIDGSNGRAVAVQRF